MIRRVQTTGANLRRLVYMNDRWYTVWIKQPPKGWNPTYKVIIDGREYESLQDYERSK